MIIYAYLSRLEVKRLSLIDRSYFKRKLSDNCMLNNLLHRPINRQLLDELQCILDSKPIPRQKAGQFIPKQFGRLSDGLRHSVRVYRTTEVVVV